MTYQLSCWLLHSKIFLQNDILVDLSDGGHQYLKIVYGFINWITVNKKLFFSWMLVTKIHVHVAV